MKKQNAQMIVLVTVLILCICGYFIVKAMPEEETEVSSEAYTVVNVDQNDVKGISYFYEGKIIDLVKENEVWTLEEDPELEVDQSIIETMLEYICYISTDTVIESPESLAEYGLSNPSNTVCLTLSDNSVVQVLIGDYMDMTGEYYALVAGDSKVYTISSYIASIFEKSLDDLIAVEKNTEEIAEESVTETATEE